MDKYGRNRRPGGAVYELLTVDTSGDDEEAGKQEDEDAHMAMAMVVKGKGKRRKHKSKRVQSLGFGAVLVGEGDPVTSSSSLEVVGLPSFKDLIAPRRDEVGAGLRLEPRVNVGEARAGVECAEGEGEVKDGAFQRSGGEGVESGQKSPSNTESLRNLATGVVSTDLVLLRSDSVKETGSPGFKEVRVNLGHEMSRAGIVPSVDTIMIENATIDGRVPELRLMSPKDRLSGRTSPVGVGIGGLSGYSPRGASQREPLFSSGSVVTELRQRAVEKSPEPLVQENGVEGGAKAGITRVVSFKKQKPDADSSYLGHVDVIEQSSGYRTPPLPRPPLLTHETPHLTEWERLMAANSEYPTVVDISPINYLRGEVQRGSLSERHSSAGIQQRRERIYNTMFHVPWRCELLIDVGFFVCLDSFLSLFTVMPARIIMFLWQRILHWRQFQRPYAAELSDFASLIILVLGVAVLQQADISFIYHYIRGQATIKLYVVFNVLEIFDKLCQSFGGDVLQILLNSAVAIGDCPPERLIKQWAQFCLDQSIAIATFLVHSLVIMSQAITVSAAINSQNNALLTLLISNNFAEIKSNVFKRVGKENLHKMAYHDTVERFHIMAHLLFVLAQNIQNSEDFWLWNFAYNAGMVFLCEVLVDVIKHSFLAKFNEIKPGAYSEFLQALCKQTLNSQSHEVHKTLHFVPLAPACVVLRVLIPLYATFLPQGPLLHRVAGIFMLGGGTYIILLALKILVGLGLQMHAAWYLKRCKHKEGHHPHAD
ncbi:hypothetical protein KC19_10G097500 [Ceratodon purpureus]|uniref:Uncharacterized protein n=1 Tax=Ceratodon purpureus TaxID=3225 RepID=A0A8T0GJZ0_CERPU|nr:hypothetical protein KC19_10G097500 [Ceratodon purpureus]